MIDFLDRYSRQLSGCMLLFMVIIGIALVAFSIWPLVASLFEV